VQINISNRAQIYYKIFLFECKAIMRDYYT